MYVFVVIYNNFCAINFIVHLLVIIDPAKNAQYIQAFWDKKATSNRSAYAALILLSNNEEIVFEKFDDFYLKFVESTCAFKLQIYLRERALFAKKVLYKYGFIVESTIIKLLINARFKRHFFDYCSYYERQRYKLDKVKLS